LKYVFRDVVIFKRCSSGLFQIMHSVAKWGRYVISIRVMGVPVQRRDYSELRTVTHEICYIRIPDPSPPVRYNTIDVTDSGSMLLSR